jgi:thiazole synthase
MSFTLAGINFTNRLLLGTALYPSLKILENAIRTANAEIITVSLRRQMEHPEASLTFWDTIKSLGCHLLPNTAGCQSAKEVILVAQMAREAFNTHWIKVEVSQDNYTLQPDPFELIEATKELISQGFEVFPYCTDDLVVCERLVTLGCRIIMPWGAPIGSGKGLNNPFALKTLRARLPEITLIVDAGIGAPSHAAQAMELGFDGVLLNSAVALAADPEKMALAFSQSISAGRLAYEAGIMPSRDFASPSTPTLGKPFWHQVTNHV